MIFSKKKNTVDALILAIPVAVGIAIFITEVAPNFLKGPIGIAIELLAAIPSIIHGMWGLFPLAPIMSKYTEPFLQRTIGKLPLVGILLEGTPLGIDLLTASTILGIMIIPFTASISRDALLYYLALLLFIMSFIVLAIAKFLILKAERRYAR